MRPCSLHLAYPPPPQETFNVTAFTVNSKSEDFTSLFVIFWANNSFIDTNITYQSYNKIIDKR